MKIRNGFVSNSSSSSFLIYGVCIDTGTLASKLTEKGKKIALNGVSEEDIEDQYDGDIAEALGIEYSSGPDGCYCYYFGPSWDSIKDDETGLQFKTRVKKEIKELIDIEDDKFCSHAEAWTD